jgi:hypothetical protein
MGVIGLGCLSSVFYWVGAIEVFGWVGVSAVGWLLSACVGGWGVCAS